MDVLIAGTSSDSHTWNLTYLQLVLEERGHAVRNLGPCVPPALLAAQARRHRTDLVVISSVNGHGAVDGLAAIRALRDRPELVGLPVVIGGKLTVHGTADRSVEDRLLEAGYDAVFADGAVDAFLALLDRPSLRSAS